jgi:menaquinone-9 beta-reductase
MQISAPTSVDLLVVGGGPAGLATAIAARRHGFSVMVADGAPPSIDKACGEGVMPDGVEALRNLGITIPGPAARPFRGIRFISGNRQAEAVFPRGAASAIRRTTLHRIMAAQAEVAGVCLRWRAPVTGLDREGALVGGELVRARWVVGADGAQSRVRHWAGLDVHQQVDTRFAFRRHYRVPPWTDFMELYWGKPCQIYVTAVGPAEICVAMISDSPHLRLDHALTEFPQLSVRLRDRDHTSCERGAITVNRRLRRVCRDRTVLVGDASGGVDAITGEGLCLAFRQATLLGECLAANDLDRYQREHRKLLGRPIRMARLMLFLGHHSRLRQRTMRVFESSPGFFAAMLAMHIGEGSTRDYVSNGIALGWQLLKA